MSESEAKPAKQSTAARMGDALWRQGVDVERVDMIWRQGRRCARVQTRDGGVAYLPLRDREAARA